MDVALARRILKREFIIRAFAYREFPREFITREFAKRNLQVEIPCRGCAGRNCTWTFGVRAPGLLTRYCMNEKAALPSPRGDNNAADVIPVARRARPEASSYCKKISAQRLYPRFFHLRE